MLTVDHDRWRDQQLAGFTGTRSMAILAQEKVMLDFVKTHKNICWKWAGNNTNFKNICQQQFCISDDNAQGVILFGKEFHQMTTKNLITKIREIIQNFDYVYVAINRYEVILHDLDFELPDQIEDSLDAIMKYCDAGFNRLHTFDLVDGNHMVAAHPMDCYGLCKL
jgi:hypothetical protein